MNLFTKDRNLHHAYCIVGDSMIIFSELEKFLEKELKFHLKNNPDFSYRKFDVMDVDDARALKESHQSMPTVGDKKIFVIEANFITEKAQNAMLKIFEEPSGSTHFFLILPSLNNVIPTLMSRMFIIDEQNETESIIDAKSFLNLAPGKRFEQIKKLMDSISDEEASKIEVVKFINSLEAELHGRTDFSKENKNTELFEQIEKIRGYVSEQSPSLKMLLEYLALLIPRV